MCAASSSSGSSSPERAHLPLYAVMTASRKVAWYSRCLTACSASRRSAGLSDSVSAARSENPKAIFTSEGRGVPIHDESREYRLVTPGRYGQKVNQRDPAVHRLAQQAAISGPRFATLESPVDGFICGIDAGVRRPRIVVPHLGIDFRKDRPYRQQFPHLRRLEYSALRMGQCDALVLEHETGLKLLPRSAARASPAGDADDRTPRHGPESCCPDCSYLSRMANRSARSEFLFDERV